MGSLIRGTFDLSKYFTNSLTPPSYERVTLFSFSSLRSANSIITPEFKNANSLNRCSKVLKSYFIFVNVSSEAQNLTSVPFLSPAGPTFFKGLVVSPLQNSTKCSESSLQILSSSLDDSALTTDTPTPCKPPETL